MPASCAARERLTRAGGSTSRTCGPHRRAPLSCRATSQSSPASGLPSFAMTHKVMPMKVGVARETVAGERRVALVPEALGKLQAAGCEVLVETGAGAGAAIPDQAYADAGAKVVSTDELYAQADVVLRVAKPTAEESSRLRK